MKKSTYLILLSLAVMSIGACKQVAGDKAEVSEAEEVTESAGISYQVNTETSTIEWEGSKTTKTHTGTLNLTEGSLIVNEGSITGGSINIDMNSLNVTDLEGDYKGMLEDHLKGTSDEKADDFFNVNKFPTANFEITKVTNLSGNPDATHMVYGNLALKDSTKLVGFHAKIEMADGLINVSTPPFVIDRTQWGIKYGSPTFFENLKDKAVANNIGLAIKLSASAPES